jgi:hypothetical protein
MTDEEEFAKAMGEAKQMFSAKKLLLDAEKIVNRRARIDQHRGHAAVALMGLTLLAYVVAGVAFIAWLIWLIAR